MKTKLAALIFLLLAGISARADLTYSNLLTYTTVASTTNNGNSIAIGNARITPPIYSLQHGPLLVTNDATYYIQISFDNVNFTTIATRHPASTNSGAIDAVTLPNQSLVVYSRVQFVTTNSTSLGGQAALGTGF